MSQPEPGRRLTRIAAYALCVVDDRLLLCRLAPGEWTSVGQWTLPGGGLDFGESPADAALRELDEETGLSGEIIGLADAARWFAPDERAALPMVDLAREAARLAFG